MSRVASVRWMEFCGSLLLLSEHHVRYLNKTGRERSDKGFNSLGKVHKCTYPLLIQSGVLVSFFVS